jgi:hypothetical protein
MGLLGKGAYLGDNWNRLDGIVVVLSLLPYAQLLIPSLSKSEGIKLIRIVRVLRPLRTVTSVEGETAAVAAPIGVAGRPLGLAGVEQYSTWIDSC